MHGVERVHPEYALRLTEWRRMEAVLAGRDAIIAGGEEFLPMLESQRHNRAEYESYQQRGLWSGSTSRARDTYTGNIFRKDPTLRLPKRLEPLRLNITGLGDTFYTFAKTQTRELLGTGRAGILLDRPREGGLPYLMGYGARQIRNWRLRRIDGRLTPDQIVLSEYDEVPSSDGFGSSTVMRYRVLELDADGTYFVRIFQQPESNADYVEIERFVPRPTGRPIDYIPFTFINPTNLSASTQKPPLLDLADVNINYWKTACDLAHGLHRVAFPQIVFTGVDDVGNTTWINDGKRVWGLPMGATFGMLEFKGDGLGGLERDLDRCQALMSKLGAKLLEDQKRVTETAEAISIRNSGETATLADISRTVGDGFQQALRWAASWEAADPDDIVVELNQDFQNAGMSSQEMLALATLYNQRLLTLEDVIWNLQRGERLRPGRTPEEIAAELENTPPMLLGQAMPLEESSLEEPQSAPGGIQTDTKIPRNGRSVS